MQPSSLAVVLICAAALAAEDQPGQQDLRQKLEMVKEKAARNRAALMHYSWTSHTDVLVNGEVKRSKDELCRYGPDGRLQKTPLNPPVPQQDLHGIRRRIVERRTGEFGSYMQRVVELIHNYVPPSPDAIDRCFWAGNISLGPAGHGAAQLELRDYFKPGDAVSLSFNIPAKALRMVTVNSYLDGPGDAVTFFACLQTLPDGTNYPASITLTATAKKLKIRVENSNYQKVVD